MDVTVFTHASILMEIQNGVHSKNFVGSLMLAILYVQVMNVVQYKNTITIHVCVWVCVCVCMCVIHSIPSCKCHFRQFRAQ